MSRIVVEVGEEVKQKLREIVRKRISGYRTESEIVRDALRDFLKNLEKETSERGG